ncbi:MAG: lytic transglycosylase domain-containing protein, partial [Actinomycetota bacterium]|nr:lytic transglycosylase domain-containing protein [Actinomycetota bacterium]
MLIRRKALLLLGLITAALAALASSALPTALADSCTVRVTVAGGQSYTFYVNVPAGTPVSSLNLPVHGVIVSESESCAPSTSTTPSVSTTSSGSGHSGSSSSTTTSSSSGSRPGSSSTPPSHSKAPGPKPTRPGRRQRPSKHGSSSTTTTTTTQGRTSHRSPPKKHSSGLPTGKGVPLPSNPSYSLSLPGPAPMGVPNFFIDSFQIPPFLMPIYQAAGIEYDVPWPVLAAINEIETDYGRNLSVSSAGAVGWMQFLPSTFKRWGVDAN